MTFFTRKIAKAVAVAMLMACAPFTANAELLLSDNFDYNAGDLYNQGGWIKLDTKTDNPIQVIASPLTYPGYQPSAIGKAALMDGEWTLGSQKLKKQFSEEPVLSGKLYYSALVKPTDISGTNVSKYTLLGFAGKNFNGFGDGVGSNSIYSVVSIAPGSVIGKFKFGIAPSTSIATYTEEYDLNSTYLVVVSYDFTSKDINLWVNPADANATATITLSGKGSISETFGVQGICIYQGSSANISSKTIIDAVRVGTSMADIFDSEGGGDQGGGDNDDATATVSPSSIDFMGVFQGSTSAAQTVTINAHNITEALTLTCTNSAFKVNPATISAEEAMAGATASVTFAPTSGQEYAGSIKVMCGSKELAAIAVKGTGVAVETPMNYAMMSNMVYEGTATDYAYYCMESRFGVVTHVDAADNRFFIQDMTGALEVSTEMLGEMPAIQEGSKIKLFYAMFMEGKLYLAMPIEASAITQGSPKSPTPYSLADIQQDPQSYWNKLVTIEDAEFAKAGEAFAASSTPATDPAGKTFNIRPFAGTDLIGTTIPAKGSVSGILVAKNGSVIWPRKAADIEAAATEEPELNVTVTNDFKDVAPINTDTRLATLTIEAKGLPAPAQLWLGGANRDLFSLSCEEIPAGTGTYEVVVTYSPKAIGAHKATINIDATPTTLSGTYALTAKAYDPANLPTITVPESVEQFNAAVGQTDKKQFTISSANMIEYGSVVIESQSTPGTFIINSSSLYPNIPNNFTVTFTPKTAGTFTATIKVEGLKAETRYISLTGVATGDTPIEEKEGTELRLDASSPLKLMVEPFDGVSKNRPIDLQGWDNVAMEGTRAWWGYKFDDDMNSAAKVTAYDFNAEEDTPAQMMLVTPALDFKNADTKLLTFRVMGEMLPEAAEKADLEVLYIEDADYMESFGNIGIPYTADQNGEWMELVIDLEDMNIADVFFIGFRYKGERGRNSSAVYYIDDVTWGRTDIPFIKVRTSDNLNAAMYGLQMTGSIGETTISEPLTVTATNLTGDITIGISGANPSKFSTSAETLPAEGGKFTVHFTPEEKGLHQASIDLKSDGAATMSVPVDALCLDPSGINDIEIDANTGDTFNLQGIRVGVKDMRSGIYIINGKKTHIRR